MALDNPKYRLRLISGDIRCHGDREAYLDERRLDGYTVVGSRSDELSAGRIGGKLKLPVVVQRGEFSPDTIQFLHTDKALGARIKCAEVAKYMRPGQKLHGANGNATLDVGRVSPLRGRVVMNSSRIPIR